jgi:hypothetical protein
MFASFNLPRIAVVYANSKDNDGAVVHATANTRHWKVRLAQPSGATDAYSECAIHTIADQLAAELIRVRDRGCWSCATAEWVEGQWLLLVPSSSAKCVQQEAAR